MNIHNQEPQVNEQQIITAMQGNAHVVKFKQLEEYVLSAPERMPEDAICEVSLYTVLCIFIRYLALSFSKAKKLRKGWVELVKQGYMTYIVIGKDVY